MRIQVRIDWQVPTSVKYSLLIGLPVLALVGGGALVHANVPNAFSTGAVLSSKQLNDNFTYLQNQITTLVPPGTIEAYGGVVDGNPIADGGMPAHPPPSGWLLCNGDPLDGSNTTYAALYAAIGTSFGGSSQAFNLPDLRGMFLRGVDNGAGVDHDSASRTRAQAGGNAGNAVGSTQGHQFFSHDHGGGSHTHNYQVHNWQVAIGSGPYPDGLTANTGNLATWTSAAPNQTVIQPQGGSETRPVNTYVNYIIKY
jgi:microcystin-dependent protein